MRLAPFDPTLLDPKTVTQRRMRIATLVLLLTAPAVLLMADLHWRSGFDFWKVTHLLLFTFCSLNSRSAWHRPGWVFV